MYAKDRNTIVDRREMLRVKLKSLAEEARIIRREEQRTHGALRAELHQHRIGVVRNESRATHLAYGFIRGLTREQMEPGWEARVKQWRQYTTPFNEEKALMAKVDAMVKKYGPKSEIKRADLALAA